MRLRFPGTIELEALPALAEGQEVTESWAQVLRTGKFKVGDRELVIDELMLDQMVENATRYNEAPFDYDHLGTSGKAAAGEARAAGWAKKWERRGNKLYAFVQWTKRAAEHIRNGEYRYVSATFLPKFFDPETAKDVGARLLGAAITNYPFVQGMDPLALAAVADVSMTDRQQRIAQAWEDRFNPFGDPSAGFVDLFYDDYIVVRKGGKSWKIDYEMDAELKVNFPSEPKEVILTPQELSTMPEVTLEQFTALQSLVTESQAKITELSAGRLKDQEEIAKLQIDLENAKTAALSTQAESTVDGLITAGKMLPKQREWALGYFRADQKGFMSFSATLVPLVRLDAEQGSGEERVGVGTPKSKKDGRLENSDKAVIEFSQKITDYRKENPKVSYADALGVVSGDNPELYAKYRESFAGFGGDESVQ